MPLFKQSLLYSIASAATILSFPAHAALGQPPTANQSAVQWSPPHAFSDNESLVESVNGLIDDADEFPWNLDGGESGSNSSYRYCIKHVAYSRRLLKICSEVAHGPNEQRAATISQLRTMLDEATKVYEANYDEYQRDVSAGKSSFNSKALPIDAKCTAAIRKAVYLLGHFQEHSSLPQLVALYNKQGPTAEHRYYRMISRVMIFAVMHELVSSHPTESLTPDAANLRSKYLDLTKALPRARRISLPTWNLECSRFTMYPLDDPRAGWIDANLADPLFELMVYPREFMNLEDSGELPTPAVDSYIQAIRAFVVAAYPAQVDSPK